uniref:Uncharacterized protein n=1 Tax=Rhizophora mucronata TaxID=61149 RepID=A0A2P2PVF6_RHIMU
MKKDDIFLI